MKCPFRIDDSTLRLWGLLIALAIGVLYVTPWLGLKIAGYRLFYPAYDLSLSAEQGHDGPMHDHLYYVALSRELKDSGFPLRTAFAPDDPKRPIRPHALAEILLGTFNVLTGSVDGMKLLATFLFPSLIAWLFFIGTWRVTGDWHAALIAPVIATAGMYPAMLKALSFGTELSEVVGVGPYGRMPHPMISAAPYLLFLGLLFLLGNGVAETTSNSGEKPSIFLHNRRVTAVSAGILLGLLVYTYHYFWTHALVVLVLWALVLALKKNRNGVIGCGMALGVAILVAIPYFLLLMKLPAELRADYSLRQALAHDRSLWLSALIPPSPAAWVLHALGIAGFVILFLRGRGKESVREKTAGGAWFVAMVAVSALIAANQQLITGLMVDPKHYYYFCFKMALAVGIAVSIASIDRWLSQKKGIHHSWLVVIILLFLIGARVQWIQARSYAQRYNLSASMEQAMSWLNRNTEPGSVVLASIGKSSILPVYTHNTTLLVHGKDMLTQDEIDRRLACWCAAFEMPTEKIREILWHVPQRQFFLDCVPWHFYDHLRAPEKIESWIDGIVELSRNVVPETSGFRMDYLLWCKGDEQLGASAEALGRMQAHPLWQQDECAIYDLRPLFERSEAQAP